MLYWDRSHISTRYCILILCDFVKPRVYENTPETILLLKSEIRGVNGDLKLHLETVMKIVMTYQTSKYK